MSTIFTKIITNQIASYKIYETELSLAFLDVFPLRKGHVLIVPKSEVDNIFDLDIGYLIFDIRKNALKVRMNK